MIFLRVFLIACLPLSYAFAGNRISIPVSVYSYDKNPDLPLTDYAGGKLGIVQPTYARSYLYVAYRYLEGTPMTAEEQGAIVDLWDERSPFGRRPGPPAKEVWLDLRRSLPIPFPTEASASRAQYRQMRTRGFIYHSTCTYDAFLQASERLIGLRERFGAGSSALRSWAEAQDVVFDRCLSPGPIPPLEDGLPLPVRLDRAYQRAAAMFHGEDFESAAKAFRGISLHKESPWSAWAPYMVGRSLLWQARVLPDDDPEYMPLLRRAQRQFEAVLLDDKVAETHDAARYLLFRILSLTDPEAGARMLGLRLMSELRAQTRFRDLDRYLTILDNAERHEWGEPGPPFEERIELGRRDRLTEWLVAFQADEPEATEYVLKRWRETRGPAWLLAALTKIDAAHPIASELLEAAEATDSEYGRASFDYHRARLLTESGRWEEARFILDRLLPELVSQASSRNRALALRAQASRSYAAALHFGYRLPAMLGVRYSRGIERHAWSYWDDRGSGPYASARRGLMPAVVDALNSSVPLSKLVELARADQTTAQAVRRNVVIALWVRAVLLKRWDLARDLTRDVAMLAPQTQSSMEEFQAASDKDAPFLSTLILLRFPGMSPKVEPGVGRYLHLEENHYDGYNWWWWHRRSERDLVRPRAVELEWVSAAERAQAQEEWDEIVGLALSGAGWLYQAVQTACVPSHAPAQCPEALYRAAANYQISERYNHGLQYPGWDWQPQMNQDPISLLRRRYPQSKWISWLDRYDGTERYEPPYRFGRHYPPDLQPRGRLTF